MSNKIVPAIETHPILRIIGPFHGFFNKFATSGFLLFCATFVALLWANIFPHSYEHLWHIQLSFSFADLTLSKSLLHWVDEALMTLFFFVVGLEIKREILIGELSSVGKALLPVFGAIGGMVVPALIYLVFNVGTSSVKGWGIPMATDIAFALAVLSLTCKSLPFGVRVFLSALAIADDIGAVLVIALFYTASVNWAYMGLAAVFTIGLAAANVLWVRHTLVYALLGIGIWLSFLGAGVHATVAGVLVALFIPARGRYDTDTFVRKVHLYLKKFECEDQSCGHTILLNQDHLNAVQSIELACHHTETPLQRLEHGLNTWVSYLIVPLFALANAGVAMHIQEMSLAFRHPAALGIIFGLVLGKPLGITIFTFVGSKLFNVPLFGGVTWLHIIGAGMLGGIGFTMSIFIAGLSFPTGPLVEVSKIGIISGSIISAILGLVTLTLMSRNRPGK